MFLLYFIMPMMSVITINSMVRLDLVRYRMVVPPIIFGAYLLLDSMFRIKGELGQLVEILTVFITPVLIIWTIVSTTTSIKGGLDISTLIRPIRYNKTLRCTVFLTFDRKEIYAVSSKHYSDDFVRSILKYFKIDIPHKKSRPTLQYLKILVDDYMKSDSSADYDIVKNYLRDNIWVISSVWNLNRNIFSPIVEIINSTGRDLYAIKSLSRGLDKVGNVTTEIKFVNGS